ncbi:hypothetical protein [Flavisphingomonas formosensis]|uniref:hypothetical protein n=1 Tax=Flavisphingomonas formosensis TaxID=861534 RepID=UPI0012F72A3F|nr:hypothetical protein [Sphingomonas formosensis]
MDYVIDTGVLAAIPESFGNNNPATPFPDCVSLKIVTQPSENGLSKEVLAHLRFGTQTLTAHLGQKQFSFNLSISKAKLRTIAIEGLKINDLSVMGARNRPDAVKIVSSLDQTNTVSQDSVSRIKAATQGVKNPLDIIQIIAGLGLETNEKNAIKTHMESSNAFEQIEAGFDDRGPVWHILPQFDIAESFRNGESSRQKMISGPVIDFGRGSLFKYKELSSNETGSQDWCILLGISAKIRDVNIDILDDQDNPWWQEKLERLGFREKREVARAALRNIIAKRISRESPEHLDGDLLFVVAAAEPAVLD